MGPIQSNETITSDIGKSPVYSFGVGESPFELVEFIPLSGGEGITGGVNKIDIEFNDLQPTGISGKISSGYSTGLGAGIGFPIELSASRGIVYFDKPVSGNSIEEIFDEARFYTVRYGGLFIKYSEFKFYTDANMNTPVFHVNAIGGGIIFGASGGRSTTNLK